MPDRIAALRAKLHAAIDDAERDGGELRIGLPPGEYRVSNGASVWYGCLIGCAVGDLPFGRWGGQEEVAEFERRYALGRGHAIAIEEGFEYGASHMFREYGNLGAEFRQRARRA